jgi:hypothetical protein
MSAARISRSMRRYGHRSRAGWNSSSDALPRAFFAQPSGSSTSTGHGAATTRPAESRFACGPWAPCSLKTGTSISSQPSTAQPTVPDAQWLGRSRATSIEEARLWVVSPPHQRFLTPRDTPWRGARPGPLVHVAPCARRAYRGAPQHRALASSGAGYCPPYLRYHGPRNGGKREVPPPGVDYAESCEEKAARLR